MAPVRAARSSHLAEEASSRSAGVVDVLMVPGDGGNPYQRLLAEALARRGAEVRTENRLSLRRALRPAGRDGVVHLHWIEFLIRSTDAGPAAGPLALARSAHLILVLIIARARGVRIVWTVHNLRPHEPRRPRLDRTVARLVARLADTVLVHSRHCATQVAERLGRSVDVAPHGNYIGFYPAPRRDRLETRHAHGIPDDAHLLLLFGLIRPYKMIPAAIAEFRRLPGDRFRLLVAGRPLNEQVQREVELAAAGDERIVLRLERIADAEVAELHLAADLAVLAYRDVFSSGALMLALSHGLPVLAAAGSTATELGAPPAVQAFSNGGLGAAMAASRPGEGLARQRALETAQRYGWDAMAAKVLGPESRQTAGAG